MTQLVTIFGGSGFIGRYIARRMAARGWRVRVATRRPNEAMFVKPYGVVGQVEPVLANIRDDASVAAAMRGSDAVVNCVGILNHSGDNTFDAVHAEGAGRIARLAAEQGVARLVHVSAIGADAGADNDYARTKAEGEAEVLRYFPKAVILRPSVVFGAEDGFFNRFAGMSRLGPILPLAGADTKFQPVFVEDVARAAELGILGQAEAGVYELGGPDVATLRELVQHTLDVIRRRRVILGLPHWMAWIIAFGFDMIQAVSLGLIPNGVLTRDQLRSLGHDNVVSEGSRGLADLGISPTPAQTVLPDYLWRFRPAGQFEEVTESARGLGT